MSKKGPHTYANVRTMCMACNMTKSDTLMNDDDMNAFILKMRQDRARREAMTPEGNGL